MCHVLVVSKSGYYAWLARPKSAQKKRRENLTAKIKRVHLESRENYGSPKITKVLQAEEVRVSEERFTRLMNERGIQSKTVKKYKATTNSKHNFPIYPNLLNQAFQVDQPGQVKAGFTSFCHGPLFSPSYWLGHGKSYDKRACHHSFLKFVPRHYFSRVIIYVFKKTCISPLICIAFFRNRASSLAYS
ncbi:IS3 family transposase [Thalassobacillus sp. CUG 92003]|uniref:IS3 family transposase n=1 Tax=Thalassobacillus sp. CUG 92003 TaxID=2736641 RepID=UPI0015E6D6BD